MSGNKKNYLIWQLYVRQEFSECMKLIESELESSNGLCEFALYTKALIKRHEGQIQESLGLFQQAAAINPHNINNLKQVGRSLFLLGKHKAAIEVYEEASKVGSPDWEIMHNKGLCLMHMKSYDKAIECFKFAVDIQPSDATFLQLGKIYTLQEDFNAAINIYMAALENSPENTEVLTTLGLIFLRKNENEPAFEYLGNSLTYDPKNPKTILAAGSIIQDHSDMDVALIKYRVAAVLTPNSPQLWNNIGMCFFGKQRFIAAIACLKKALYLGPFEWIISYNLGLVHLHTGQWASAFHYLSSAVNLKPDFASSYMYLAITLFKLEDADNACAAYEKAIKLANAQGTLEPVFHLNYAILLHQNKEPGKAKEHFGIFSDLFDALDEETRRAADPDLVAQAQALAVSMN